MGEYSKCRHPLAPRPKTFSGRDDFRREREDRETETKTEREIEADTEAERPRERKSRETVKDIGR